MTRNGAAMSGCLPPLQEGWGPFYMSVHRGSLFHNLSTLIVFQSISLFVCNFTQTVQFQMIYASCQLKFSQRFACFCFSVKTYFHFFSVDI